METRIDIAGDEPARVDEIRQTLRTMEGVKEIHIDEGSGAIVVDHDEDVISSGELVSNVGAEGGVVTDGEQQEGREDDAGRAVTDASPEADGAADEKPESGPSQAGERPGKLPRTTTTGDDAQDIRAEGAGAEQDLETLEAVGRGEALEGGEAPR